MGKRVNEAESFKVVLRMERRDDGGLRVWSEHVPGLVLSHKDPQRVLRDIKPALETILTSVCGYAIEAFPLPLLPEVKKRAAAARQGQQTTEKPVFERRRTLEYAAVACHG